jgi:hypothetical protein
MKRHLLKPLLVSSGLLAASLCRGQTQPPSDNDYIQPVPLEQKRPELRNRISLSYRMGLNVTADFKNLGGFVSTNNPGPATGGVADRTYDNGYNRVDIANNDHGPGFENTTWYWGYTDPNSIQGGSLVLNNSSSPANGVSRNNANDPQHGLEIAYSRELHRAQNGWKFGLEGALGYTFLSIDDSRTLRASVTRLTDWYPRPGNPVPPPAPYAGTYAGPGTVIGSEPFSRTITNIVSEALVDGARSLDAHVFSLRMGPYAEVPLNDRFSLYFSGGLYLVAGQTRFSFKETVTIPGVGSQTRSGSGWQTDFLVGGYVGGNVEYALSEEVGLFVGAQLQSAGRVVNDEKGKKAIINLDKSVVVSFGASYSF